MASAKGAASGTQVLVLDDEVIVALDLADMVRDAGFDVLGPFHSPDKALEAIAAGPAPAIAILDVNLGRHGSSKPVAERLAALGCDFAFLSGYNVAGSDLTADFPDVPRFPKPIDVAHLSTWLESHRPLP